jgi:soluble cytochrome b562
MKIRPALLCLVALPILAPRLVRADDPPPPAAAAPAMATPPAGGPGDEKKTDIDLRMDKMGKAFRKLRKQVSDSTQNASSIALVGTMIAAAKEAENFKPEKTEDVPADQQAKFLSDFVAGLKGMEDALQKVSDALTAGDNAGATKMVADIAALEKKDHKEFRRPENH